MRSYAFETSHLSFEIGVLWLNLILSLSDKQCDKQVIKLGSVGHVLYSKSCAILQKVEFPSADKGTKEIKLCCCELKVVVSSLHLVPILLLRDLMGNRNSEHREASPKQYPSP